MKENYLKGKDLEQTILGIDIGSTKICAIIANYKDGIPHIIGTGFHKSSGLKKALLQTLNKQVAQLKMR